MRTEVIANLWSFVHKSTGILYELGVRLYMVCGEDNDKFELLHVLANADFHLAARFPVPDNYEVHLIIGPGQTLDAKGAIHIGGLGYGGPGIEGTDWFQRAFDSIEKNLPMHRIRPEGKKQLSAPFNRDDLLYVHTFVQVDDQGRQIPQATKSRPKTDKPAAIANLWAFQDAQQGNLFALAGRAYMVHTLPGEYASLLKTLSPHDYMLASRHNVPDLLLRSQGPSAQLAALTSNREDVFKTVIDGIERDVPVGHLDWQKTKPIRADFPRTELTFNTTTIKENADGAVGWAVVKAVAQKPWWKFW